MNFGAEPNKPNWAFGLDNQTFHFCKELGIFMFKFTSVWHLFYCTVNASSKLKLWKVINETKSLLKTSWFCAGIKIMQHFFKDTKFQEKKTLANSGSDSSGNHILLYKDKSDSETCTATTPTRPSGSKSRTPCFGRVKNLVPSKLECNKVNSKLSLESQTQLKNLARKPLGFDKLISADSQNCFPSCKNNQLDLISKFKIASTWGHFWENQHEINWLFWSSEIMFSSLTEQRPLRKEFFNRSVDIEYRSSSSKLSSVLVSPRRTLLTPKSLRKAKMVWSYFWDLVINLIKV